MNQLSEAMLEYIIQLFGAVSGTACIFRCRYWHRFCISVTIYAVICFHKTVEKSTASIIHFCRYP